jgi:hypothetical protein
MDEEKDRGANKIMAPSIGNTAKEIFQRWRDMPQAVTSDHLVVGKITGEGVYSWRNGQIIREETIFNKHGNAATFRPATQREIDSIHEAIERGWFQIEAHSASGCLGVRKTKILLERVYHQATGRPPGSLPIQPTKQPVRKTRKKKSKPEMIFTGDRVVIADSATGRLFGE